MAYPALPIDNRSERKTVNLTSTNITASGTVRQRNFQNTVLYEFKVIHSMISKTDADSVFSDWAANKTAEVTFVWVDGLTYVVRYQEPPHLTHERGPWWKVHSKLIGYAQ